MIFLTLNGTQEVVVGVGVGVFVWIALALTVAHYGAGRGFPYFPVFVCALFLGFPLVLLAVTVAPARPHR